MPLTPPLLSTAPVSCSSSWGAPLTPSPLLSSSVLACFCNAPMPLTSSLPSTAPVSRSSSWGAPPTPSQQLAIGDFLCVWQCIVIDEIFLKQIYIVYCIFQYFSSLSTNTTGVTTVTTMASAAGNGPLAPHMRPCAPCQCIEWMGDNPPSLWMFLGGGLRVCMALKVLLVPAMMHCQNIRVFWGPYTPTTAPKIISTCSGGCQTTIQHIGLERKASCRALGGHFCGQRPWSAVVVLVDIGHWRLTSDQPTVGIVTIVYGSIFFIPT